MSAVAATGLDGVCAGRSFHLERTPPYPTAFVDYVANTAFLADFLARMQLSQGAARKYGKADEITEPSVLRA